MKIGFGSIQIPGKENSYEVSIEPLGKTNDNQKYAIKAINVKEKISIGLILELTYAEQQKITPRLVSWVLQ